MTESSSWFKDLTVLMSWLTPRRRVQLAFLFGLAIIGALAELATLGAIFPFLMALANPDRILSTPLVGWTFSWLRLTDDNTIVIAVTILFAITVLFAAILRLALMGLTAKFSNAVGHDLSVRLLERVLHQPYSFHTSRNTSEVIAGVVKADTIVVGVLIPLLDLLVAAMMALAIVCGLVLIDGATAFFAGTLFVLIYWIISLVSRNQLSRNSRVLSASMTARVQGMQEGLGGIRDIILDGSQHLHLNRFATADKMLRRAAFGNTTWSQAPRYVVEALGISVIAGLAVSTKFSSGGIENALPVLGALALGAQKLLPLFQRTYSAWSSVVGNRGILEDVKILANMPLAEGSRVRPDTALLPFQRKLALSNVGFRYRADTPWVIRNLNLEIPKGARVGFVGQTGCGKSTLLDLIMGLLSPSEGQMKVDGIALTEANRRHWQARIAHVPQSIFLADASLQANIAFGEPLENIDIERVVEAAKRARVHDFIEKLNDGYGTRVGERGVQLSGGQRQRVGIARALFRMADVIVLDEATSALDGNTEASVMKGITELGSDITLLIVAHRLSTLQGCDFIVKMSASGIAIVPGTEVAHL